MEKLADKVFYDRQLELAERISEVAGLKFIGFIVTEHLYFAGTEFEQYERNLSYSVIRQATQKKRVNVTLVFEEQIPDKARSKINKIFGCHYEIYGNQIWYSMKPSRLDYYMRTN